MDVGGAHAGVGGVCVKEAGLAKVSQRSRRGGANGRRGLPGGAGPSAVPPPASALSQGLAASASPTARGWVGASGTSGRNRTYFRPRWRRPAESGAGDCVFRRGGGARPGKVRSAPLRRPSSEKREEPCC